MIKGALLLLSVRGFAAAIRAEICSAVLSAGAFPRLYGSLRTAVGTEFSLVRPAAGAVPHIARPCRGGMHFRCHAEQVIGSCHILKSHNGETVDKHSRHLTFSENGCE